MLAKAFTQCSCLVPLKNDRLNTSQTKNRIKHFITNIPGAGTQTGGDRDAVMVLELCPPPSVSGCPSTVPLVTPGEYCSPPTPPDGGCPLGITGFIPSLFLPYLTIRNSRNLEVNNFK